MMPPLFVMKLLVALACLVVINTVPHRTILIWTTSIGPMACVLHKAAEQGASGYRLAILGIGVALMTAANIHFWCASLATMQSRQNALCCDRRSTCVCLCRQSSQ